MILNLNFDEIDVLTEALRFRRDASTFGFNDVILTDLENRMEAICHQSAEPVATAWEVGMKNDNGRVKLWLRTVEVRIFSEMLYVFRARAEDLLALPDPIHEHWIVVGTTEYRTTEPAPAEIHLKALTAFRGVAVWMVDAGITPSNVRKEWT